MGGVGANKARLGRERARSEGRRRAAERSAVKLLRAAARSRILVATQSLRSAELSRTVEAREHWSCFSLL